jgi:hypothetical protein
MNYDLAKPVELIAARSRLTYLARKRRRVHIKEVRVNRTLSQNSYLHLILAAFGAHFGYTLEEAKMVYKDINSAVYRYNKKGRTFIRSSADLSKEEMARTIDHFMEKSKEAGYELPLATDQEWLLQIENEIERNRHYL